LNTIFFLMKICIYSQYSTSKNVLFGDHIMWGWGTLQCIYISFIAIAHRGTWLLMKFGFCITENATMQNDECWVIFRNYTKPPHVIGFVLTVHNHNSQRIKYKILIYQKIKYLIMIYNCDLFLKSNNHQETH
jgi:hypothetical protein